jgi:hypothetical protein
MLVQEVEKDDCKKLADFLNSLRSCVGGGSSAGFQAMIHFADGVRWLQELAVNMATVYSAEMEGSQEKPKKEGFTVKNYSPGASE